MLQILLAGWLGISVFGTFAILRIAVLLNNVNQALVTFPMMTLLTRQVNPIQYTFAVAILQVLLLPIYTFFIYCQNLGLSII
ncbi:MAG TPA: hypothetical protein DDY13_07515 [Cytophagales bacterium]|nr:hypothetical protein [Cytophagales bacterium]